MAMPPPALRARAAPASATCGLYRPHVSPTQTPPPQQPPPQTVANRFDQVTGAKVAADKGTRPAACERRAADATFHKAAGTTHVAAGHRARDADARAFEDAEELASRRRAAERSALDRVRCRV